MFVFESPWPKLKRGEFQNKKNLRKFRMDFHGFFRLVVISNAPAC